jgi:ubiquinone/menaquinone biosynthesis C-methylase UbiE
MKSKKQTGLYKHWQKIADHQEKDFRASSLRRLISANLDLNLNVLDLGCGTCDLTQDLLEKKVNVYSADISKEMIQMSKRKLESKNLSTRRLQQASISSLVNEYENYFDQIVSLDVIEHIKNDNEAIKSMYKLIVPGGILLLTVPALQKLYGKKDEELGHYRRYKKDHLILLLKRAGFEIIKIRYWNLIGVPAVWFSNNLLNTNVSESFRYKNSFISKMIQKILYFWFAIIENHFNFGVGLTLFVIAKRPKK